MEALKPEITSRYQKYQDAVKRRNQLKSQTDTPTASHESLVLSAAEHKDMALQLANRELRRRAKDSRDDNAVMDDLSRGIQDLGRRIDAPRQSSHPSSTSQPSSTYHYPLVPSTHASISQSSTSLAPSRPPKNDLPTTPHLHHSPQNQTPPYHLSPQNSTSQPHHQNNPSPQPNPTNSNQPPTPKTALPSAPSFFPLLYAPPS